MLLVLFVVFCAAQTNKNQLFESCLYPTVVVFDPANETGGSAFIVRCSEYGKKFRNAIVTAQHTVESNGPFFVKIFKSDEKLPTAKLNFDHKILMGDDVFHVGFGMMDDARIDFGKITQTKTYKPDIFKGLIRTNAYSMVGDSGGPLFQNSDYKVIGVCRAIRKHKDQLMNHQSYFTDIKSLQKWNEQLDNALEPIYTDKRELPKLPFIKMDLQKYKYKIPD